MLKLRSPLHRRSLTCTPCCPEKFRSPREHRKYHILRCVRMLGVRDLSLEELRLSLSLPYPPVPNTFFMNPSGLSFLASRSLSAAKAGQPLPMRSNVSLTVFFALCVLAADFMIYFFFKLLYSEKHRTRPRRLPREYYSKEEKTSPLPRGSVQNRPAGVTSKPANGRYSEL
jgi:hypothetical protein